MTQVPLQLTFNNHNTDVFPQFEGGDFSHLTRFFSMIQSKVKEFHLDGCPGLIDSKDKPPAASYEDRTTGEIRVTSKNLRSHKQILALMLQRCLALRTLSISSFTSVFVQAPDSGSSFNLSEILRQSPPRAPVTNLEVRGRQHERDLEVIVALIKHMSRLQSLSLQFMPKE